MSVMVTNLAIDLVIPEGVPMVFYAREICTSKLKECQHLDVRLVNRSKKTEGGSNSVTMVTGLTFAMTTHPPCRIYLRDIMRSPG